MLRDFRGGPSALPLQGVQVQSLVRELRSHMPLGTAKKERVLNDLGFTKRKGNGTG